MAENNSNVPLGAVILVATLCFVSIPLEGNEKNLSLPIVEKLKHLDPAGTAIFLGSILSLLLVLVLVLGLGFPLCKSGLLS